MKIVIVCLNQKGGVGKSTTAVHLLAMAAQDHPREDLLLIDSDTQQSSSLWVSGRYPTEAIVDPDQLWERLLDRQSLPIVTIVDCPCGLTMINQNSLLACDYAVIPVQPSTVDILALQEALRLLRMVQRQRRGFPSAGLLLSRVKPRSTLNSEAQEFLRSDRIKSVAELFDVSVPERALMQRLPGLHQTVWDYSDGVAVELQRIYFSIFQQIQTAVKQHG